MFCHRRKKFLFCKINTFPILCDSGEVEFRSWGVGDETAQVTHQRAHGASRCSPRDSAGWVSPREFLMRGHQTDCRMTTH